jgi:tetratricopeptide (TPR) repeat protein
MRKSIIFLFIFLSTYFLFQSCNIKITPSATSKSSNLLYDSTAFDYVFTEAIKQKFMGNPGDALRYLEQCIKINPQSDAAYYELAQIALMLPDYHNGKKFALKAISLNEKNLWYLMLIANIYYQEKKIDSAILFYEKAINYFPDKENIKINLANIYSENKNFRKAGEIYNYLENQYGVNETITLSIIKNFINSGDYKNAELKVRELLSKSPEELLYNGLLAEIYRSSGEKEKAVAIYNKLLEENPGNPRALLSLYDFLLNEKQFDDLFPLLNVMVLNDSILREDKITIFSKLINDTTIIKSYGDKLELVLLVLEAANKEDGIMVLLRTELYVNQNKIEQAIFLLEDIIAEQPENYFAWEKVLVLYSETKNWDKLFKKGEECATKFNRSYLAKILYANAAMEKTQFAIAEEELRKARILAGSDTDKIIQVLVINADLFYRKKEYFKSFETFKEALKLDPADIMILNNYAYYLAEQDIELKEAERMAKKVITKEKNNTTYLDTYAWILYKRGRYKEAEKIMDFVIKNSGKEDAEYFEHLGYILKARRLCEKAAEYWMKAYSLDTRKSKLLKEIENCKSH